MLIAALFKIAKYQIQPKCQTTDKHVSFLYQGYISVMFIKEIIIIWKNKRSMISTYKSLLSTFYCKALLATLKLIIGLLIIIVPHIADIWGRGLSSLDKVAVSSLF